MASPFCGDGIEHARVGPERRRHPRVRRRGLAYFADGEASYATGHLLDLSAGGLRLATRERLEVGTEVYLGLVLDETRGTLVVSALVRRCRETDGGFEAGLEFTSVSSDVARALAHLIRGRMSLPV